MILRALETITASAALMWMGFIAVAVILVYLGVRVKRRFRYAWPQDPADNGIRVGRAKVYDNRSLSLMLEQLRDQLRTIQSIDAGSITASIGTQQGELSASFEGSLEGTFPGSAPIEKSDAKSKSKAQSAGDSKSGTPPAEKATGDSKSQPPSPPASPASPFKWSERAADLLTDQMNLSYEIFNLRLLLERALSDRLLGDKTRVQAVIGIPISIDPPPYSVDCAATIEVRLTVADSGPSLVAMFPQQETYNTWGVDRRSFHFGAGGATPQGSVSTKAAGDSSASYLHRHVETVAMEKESSDKELVLAWQFRPMQGDRTVAPGLRQMLAVLALSSPDEGDQSVSMNVNVKSSWQHWDRKTQTAKKGVGWRAVFSNRPTQQTAWTDQGNVDVPTTGSLEKNLAPTIANIEWMRVGPTKAAIVVSGTNFFAGTTVVMGDTVLNAENGLTIKSERSFQLIAPLPSLTSDALLNGRYGMSKKMQVTPSASLQAMRITSCALEPDANNQSYRVTVWLATTTAAPIDRAEFDRLPDPILSINGRVVPGVFVFTSDPDNNNQVMGIARVTSDFVPSQSVLVEVLWPFLGDAWSLHYQTYEPKKSIDVMRVLDQANTTLLLSGPNFEDGVVVLVDKSYLVTEAGPLTRLKPDLLKCELPTVLLDRYQQIFVAQPGEASVPVPLPPRKAAACLSLDLSKKPPSVRAGAGGTVEYSGTGLDAISSVTMDDKELAFISYAAGTSISVLIDSQSITEVGKKELTFKIASGISLKGTLFVVSSTQP